MICHKCGKTDFTYSSGCNMPKEIGSHGDDWICVSTKVPEEKVIQLGLPSFFYIVWSPQGVRPPKYKHRNKGGATTEAERLSKLNPGAVFFVLEVTGGVINAGGCNIKFDIDDIPF